MAPVRSYTNWNSRSTDYEKQIEPYRKYFFICEAANTETRYFRKLIDIRKFLNIHPLIDIRLLEKTEEDKDISFPRKLITFAESQKNNPEISFDEERDKMIIVFDAELEALESGEILDKYRFISTIIDGDTITKPMNLTVSELEALSRFWRVETDRKDMENLQMYLLGGRHMLELLQLLKMI